MAHEWFMDSRYRTFAQLACEAERRVDQALARCGYAGEDCATGYVGEEFMAILDRLTDGWAALCASSDPAARQSLVHRMAEHLWAVKNDGRAPLAPQDRARAQETARVTCGYIGGKDLLLTLAEVLGNDADLVPIFEARHLRIDAAVAKQIGKEAYRQWTIDRLVPKPVFRKALMRRLVRAAGL